MTNSTKPSRWVPSRYRITETELVNLSLAMSILKEKGWTVAGLEKYDADSLSDFRATAYRQIVGGAFESKILDVNTITRSVCEAAL